MHMYEPSHGHKLFLTCYHWDGVPELSWWVGRRLQACWLLKEWVPEGGACDSALVGTMSSLNADFKWASLTPWVNHWCGLKKVNDASFSSESSEQPKDEMTQEWTLLHSLILVLYLLVIQIYIEGLWDTIYCFTLEISNQTRSALTDSKSVLKNSSKFCAVFWLGFSGNKKISKSGWSVSLELQGE